MFYKDQAPDNGNNKKKITLTETKTTGFISGLSSICL